MGSNLKRSGNGKHENMIQFIPVVDFSRNELIAYALIFFFRVKMKRTNLWIAMRQKLHVWASTDHDASCAANIDCVYTYFDSTANGILRILL